MKHSILILDDYIKSFSNVGVGIDTKYVFAYKDKQDVFKDSSVGDKIVGFLNAPTDQFVYIFEIATKINDKECELRKQIEVESGLDLNNSSKNLIKLINANRATKLFFDISEKEYNLLLQQMVNTIQEKYRTVTDEDSRPLKFDAGFKSEQPRNRIIFGAPGTGKSRRLDDDVAALVGKNTEQCERVTFHPEYTYGSFVGTYKPIESVDSSGNEIITYKYVPGPFMRMLVKALKSERSDSPQPYVLIVEEINRANVAAVFGDVFQLLDRKNNFSEYPIAPAEDVKRFIYEKLGVKCEELRLPDNFFIWATMNSADQGVFPMDTAFKRRWSFEYIGVDEGEKDISGTSNVPGSFVMNKGESNEVTIKWNAFRKAINELLSCEDVKVPEDKLLGPFFVNSNNYMKDIAKDELEDDFYKVIETKVLMYLFEDAAKTKRSSVFVGKANTNRFSVLCQAFEENPLGIFAKIGTKEFTDVYTSFVS